jgi:hypothetical protein
MAKNEPKVYWTGLLPPDERRYNGDIQDVFIRKEERRELSAIFWMARFHPFLLLLYSYLLVGGPVTFKKAFPERSKSAA